MALMLEPDDWRHILCELEKPRLAYSLRHDILCKKIRAYVRKGPNEAEEKTNAVKPKTATGKETAPVDSRGLC